MTGIALGNIGEDCSALIFQMRREIHLVEYVKQCIKKELPAYRPSLYTVEPRKYVSLLIHSMKDAHTLEDRMQTVIHVLRWVREYMMTEVVHPTHFATLRRIYIEKCDDLSLYKEELAAHYVGRLPVKLPF